MRSAERQTDVRESVDRFAETAGIDLEHVPIEPKGATA
jgi:hypothetical protein